MNILSAIAESIIAVCAVVALWQIKIAKEDIRTRSKREAVSLAINQVEYFRSEVIKNFNQIIIEFGNLSPTKESHLFNSKLNLEDFTLEEINKNKHVDKFINKFKYISSIDFFNRLLDIANEIEYFSLAFTSKAADENVAFNPTADIFCQFIEEHYEIYCNFRKEGNYRSYASTISLYKIWKSRIMKNRLDFKKEVYSNELREDLNKINKENLKSILPLGIN